jgi:hypothetical protein
VRRAVAAQVADVHAVGQRATFQSVDWIAGLVGAFADLQLLTRELQHLGHEGHLVELPFASSVARISARERTTTQSPARKARDADFFESVMVGTGFRRVSASIPRSRGCGRIWRRAARSA